MAYPSGSGSEIVRRGCLEDLSNSTTSFKWDGPSPSAGTATDTVPANHIITVTSMIMCEAGGSATAETIAMWGSDGSGYGYLMKAQNIPGDGVFVWNDRFSLIGGDYLKVVLASAGNVDIWYTYIDQNWED